MLKVWMPFEHSIPRFESSKVKVDGFYRFESINLWIPPKRWIICFHPFSLLAPKSAAKLNHSRIYQLAPKFPNFYRVETILSKASKPSSTTTSCPWTFEINFAAYSPWIAKSNSAWIPPMFFESDQYAISTAFRSAVCLFEFAFFVFDLIEFIFWTIIFKPN